MNILNVDKVPGLYLIENYFTESQCQTLIDESLVVHEQLTGLSVESDLNHIDIPQPDFVNQSDNALDTHKAYKRLRLDQTNAQKKRCEFFPDYGGNGHDLAYFRGSANLPDFASTELSQTMHDTMVSLGLAQESEKMAWRLTMNFFKNIQGSVAGFPFHVDLPANGRVTIILNIQRAAKFQIAKEGQEEQEQVVDLDLPIGAILVLSGESRYQWKHRVLDTSTADHQKDGDMDRISLVLGFQ